MMRLNKIRDLLKPSPSKPEGRPSGTASEDEAEISVLFVCMGNICRSPTAEGVFSSRLAERAPELKVYVDSAGTHAYHVGDGPDMRARRAAERRGVDLTGLRARKVTGEDFARFHYILAMDRLNREALVELSAPEFRDRIHLFLEFAPQIGELDVPDPYYGGSHGFEHVLDLVEEASLGFIEHLLSTKR